jgi:DNA-binding beta-propeller fold protein YncE
MKKNDLLSITLALLMLLGLVTYVMGSVGPLQTVATIILDSDPKCIAINEETNRVYIGAEDGLVIINGETDTVIAKILPDIRIEGLAFNPKTNLLYACGEKIVIIDCDINQQVGEIDYWHLNQREIAVNPVTNLIYIANNTGYFDEYDRIDVYSGETNTFVTFVNIPGSNVHPYIELVGVAVDPQLNRIYAAWGGADDNLYVIDGNTHDIIDTVQLSSSFISPQVAVNSFTHYIYVGSVVLDGETLEELVAHTNYEFSQGAIDPVNNFLYAMGSWWTLDVLNGTTHEILTSLELDHTVFSSPDFVAVNCKTSKVYLVSEYNELIPVIIPEFQTWTFILLVLLVFAVVLLFYRPRLLQNQHTKSC